MIVECSYYILKYNEGVCLMVKANKECQENMFLFWVMIIGFLRLCLD